MSEILYHFLHHLGWGMLCSLFLVPPKEIARSFFIVNAATIVGLWVTALILRSNASGAGWDPWTLAASALVVAAAALDPARWTRVVVTLGVLATALAAVTLLRGASALSGEALYNRVAFLGLSFAASGLLAGGTLVAMILGHYYLVSPQLSFGLLGRFNWLLGILLGLRLVLISVPVAMGDLFVTPEGAYESIFFVDHLAFLLQRGLTLVFLATLIPMIADCVKRRANQSATGLLYVASFLALMGEGVAAYFAVSYNIPL